MGAQEFGGLVDETMRAKGLTQGRVAFEIGRRSDGRMIMNETQVRRIRDGQRTLTPDLITYVIDVLDLDPAEAWVAAGMMPPGLTADHLRKLDIFAGQDRQLAAASAPGRGMPVTLRYPALAAHRHRPATAHPTRGRVVHLAHYRALRRNAPTAWRSPDRAFA